ncbi:endonuclease/exonuclease/phosphatase family protein [Antarcticimicrobium sediminis]|uniref:Endonuclease/exonuclease/phosphatase family protein n=1 Tax=Antarcticimicrobium sediminis TaxID=2546227 RepID=A0A4V2Z846_9RHOB|nr:endonuclease/exonuclease/phosphatase family protein [Antarcticimicrobium sediminis]
MSRAVALFWSVLLALTSAPLWAESLRVASFNTELQRAGPGLLLRDIRRDEDAGIAAVVAVIALADADILALQGVDWDYEGQTLAALADRLAEAGTPYPHRLALQPNSGRASGLDLDGDGKTNGPGDSQGYGAFTGQGGIAVLSRFPIRLSQVQDFSDLLWRDFPGALLPTHPDGSPFPSDPAQSTQRLSSTGHWVVPITLPDGSTLTLLTFQAGPPVFDGAEDRNGRRNQDEVIFWSHYLDGAFGLPPTGQFVIAGGANLDPQDGAGRHEAIRALLHDPRLIDPRPASDGAAQAGDQGHHGPDRLDTVDWDGPGRQRVDYVLPSSDWAVQGTGVLWPGPGAPGHGEVQRASRHRLVWVDLGR